MEKIIEAIAKAKARGGVAGTGISGKAGLANRRRLQSDTHHGKPARVTLDPEHLAANRVISFERTDPKAASFDMLRTQVLQQMNENRWQVLALTSPTKGCGKTLSAINLAFSVAHQQAQTVILVDLDLRKPAIANCLGIETETSLFDYLCGEAELESIFVSPGLPSLLILANNRPVRNASEIITSGRIADLVSSLRQLFPSGIFIFDLPPLLVTDDVIAFFPQADCTLLVIASGQSTVSDVENSAVHLESTNFLGIALNKFEGATESYY